MSRNSISGSRRSRSLPQGAAVQITISEQSLERILRSIFEERPAAAVEEHPVVVDEERPTAVVERRAVVKETPSLRPSLRPTLRPWIGLIDEIVKADIGLPMRVQTSAMRILHILRERGYTGCYNVVQEYVHQLRDPEAAVEYRKPRNRKKESPEISMPPPDQNAPPTPEEAENKNEAPQSPTVLITRSLRAAPRRPMPEPEDVAYAWMRGLQQGSIPLEALCGELYEIPEDKLKVLREAAMRGKLPQRNHAVAVMSYARGISIRHICHFLQVAKSSVLRHVKIYREDGVEKLLTRRERSDKLANDETVGQIIFSVLHAPPSAYGFNRTSWTMANLVEAVSSQGRHVGAPTIRAIIKKSGFRWKHARIVLTSNDPEYKEKVAAIQELLSDFPSDAAFFSIDEYGPFAIKMKGGKKLVAPGEQYVVPQYQKSRGYTILTAALELSRNQVTHFYSRKKNTGEMIRMADVLREQYRSCRTLYLSWDAASWHISKALIAHLEKINRNAEADGYPEIKTMPLPACAQFLNVIESVFSGMARAIIHNSDYPSVAAAQQAIDLYFEKRNQHFRENPRRAGKKIWGLERVPSAFSESQNCKDPMYQYLS